MDVRKGTGSEHDDCAREQLDLDNWARAVEMEPVNSAVSLMDL